MKRFTLLVVVALVSVACLGSDFADSLEGSWQLTSGTVNGEEVPIIDTHPITITFEDGRVSGTASCNSYGGEFDLSGSSISFGDLAMTEMACMPPETMDAEQIYAQGLLLVDTVTIDDGLVLSGPDVELVFDALAPTPDAGLTGTVWVLDGLISGDAVSSVAAERSTLEFFTDGSMLGDTGCRPFSATYSLDGNTVSVDGLESDGHECDPSLADQDTHVFETLASGFQIGIDGDVLTITSGDTGLVYRSDS